MKTPTQGPVKSNWPEIVPQSALKKRKSALDKRLEALVKKYGNTKSTTH